MPPCLNGIVDGMTQKNIGKKRKAKILKFRHDGFTSREIAGVLKISQGQVDNVLNEFPDKFRTNSGQIPESGIIPEKRPEVVKIGKITRKKITKSKKTTRSRNGAGSRNTIKNKLETDRGNDQGLDINGNRVPPGETTGGSTNGNSGAPGINEKPTEVINFIGGKNQMGKKENNQDPNEDQDYQCANCGARFTQKNKYCPNCGLEIDYED